eukprot:12133064-Karenia_brevis.AAC.1
MAPGSSRNSLMRSFSTAPMQQKFIFSATYSYDSLACGSASSAGSANASRRTDQHTHLPPGRSQ